jgi:hypothetical protein
MYLPNGKEENKIYRAPSSSVAKFRLGLAGCHLSGT